MSVLLLALLLALSNAQIAPVTFPPGVFVGGTVPFRQYAGYVTLDSGKKIFSWFTEASEADAASAPVVIFQNGGPGCSSLGDGLFSEVGPFELLNNGTQVRLRTTAWNKGRKVARIVAGELCPHFFKANLLFFDTPVGVGLSYMPGAGPNATYSIDDRQTARDNAELLEKWYQAFPQFLNNPLFITGESYAGTYIPTWVLEILQTKPKLASILKGFMIGNPCTSQVEDHSAFFELVKSHAIISPVLAATIEALCPPTMRFIIDNTCCSFNFTNMPTQSQACIDALNKMYTDFSNINLYNIYGSCDAPVDSFSPCLAPGFPPLFLNNDSMRAIIHAAPVAVTGQWTACASLNYTSNYQSIADQIYPVIFGLKPSLRILIYSGDTDGCVPWFGTDSWTRRIGGPLVTQWGPWSVAGQVAGYFTRYTNLAFATVKGSGHMVPQYKPQQALAMFEQYLNNTF